MKIFIVGYGRMGQRHHEAVKNVFGSAAFVSVFDPNYKKISEEKTIQVNSLEDLKTLTSTQNPDFAIIASTASSHTEYIKFFVECNTKYILCEKPLCISLQECSEIEKMVNAHQHLRVAVNHQMRFMEQYTLVKDLMNTQEFGGLCSISIQAGNFGAAMNGTYYLEMFRFLSDEYPHKVWAWLNPQSTVNPRGAQFTDVAGCIRVESKNGIRMYMDISENQGHGLLLTYTCKYGQIQIDELAGKVYLTRRKNQADFSLPTTRYGMESHTEVLNIKQTCAVTPTEMVIKSLLDNSNYPTVTQGNMAVKCLMAAYASSENSHSEMMVDNLPASYFERVFPWA